VTRFGFKQIEHVLSERNLTWFEICTWRLVLFGFRAGDALIEKVHVRPCGCIGRYATALDRIDELLEAALKKESRSFARSLCCDPSVSCARGLDQQFAFCIAPLEPAAAMAAAAGGAALHPCANL
jgi:hypothetical protein